MRQPFEVTKDQRGPLRFREPREFVIQDRAKFVEVGVGPLRGVQVEVFARTLDDRATGGDGPRPRGHATRDPM